MCARVRESTPWASCCCLLVGVSQRRGEQGRPHPACSQRPLHQPQGKLSLEGHWSSETAGFTLSWLKCSCRADQEKASTAVHPGSALLPVRDLVSLRDEWPSHLLETELAWKLCPQAALLACGLCMPGRQGPRCLCRQLAAMSEIISCGVFPSDTPERRQLFAGWRHLQPPRVVQDPASKSETASKLTQPALCAPCAGPPPGPSTPGSHKGGGRASRLVSAHPAERADHHCRPGWHHGHGHCLP